MLLKARRLDRDVVIGGGKVRSSKRAVVVSGHGAHHEFLFRVCDRHGRAGYHGAVSIFHGAGNRARNFLG